MEMEQSGESDGDSASCTMGASDGAEQEPALGAWASLFTESTSRCRRLASALPDADVPKKCIKRTGVPSPDDLPGRTTHSFLQNLLPISGCVVHMLFCLPWQFFPSSAQGASIGCNFSFLCFFLPSCCIRSLCGELLSVRSCCCVRSSKRCKGSIRSGALILGCDRAS